MSASSPALPAAAVLRRKVLRTLFWFIAVTLLFNLMFGEMGIIQGIRQRRTTSRLESDVQTLRSRNEALLAEIRDLRENPHRIETMARQELGLCRPGEIIFLFPGGEPQDDLPR